MRYRIPGLAMAASMLLAACGRPDASGVYLVNSSREATLIQLSQDKDGGVSGRVEVIAIGPGGVVEDRSAQLEGAASGHELAFKPARVWSGGASASGVFTRGGLTLRRGGIETEARKASLADFQKAVAQLKARAGEERRRASEAEARQAAQAPDAAGFDEAGDKGAKLKAAANGLRADAARLDEAVSAAPDFGRQAADNSARIAQLAQTAPSLSRAERGRLAASASQVVVGTNQIDIARARYAIGLDPIIQRAAPVATAVERFCDTPQAAPFARPCADAAAAATSFESAQVRAAVVFKGFKQAVQAELARQNQLAAKIGG